MQELHLVGFTTDRRNLIFSTRQGAKSGSFLVPVDEDLLAAVVELGDEMAEADVEEDDLEEAVVPPVPDTRVDAKLSVREVQARLRAGEDVEEIASRAGVEPEWVERFAPPIRAEQQQIVERALASRMERPRAGLSSVPLRLAVSQAMAERDVPFTATSFAEAWSARLVGADRWAVEFTFVNRGRPRTVSWTYEAVGRRLTTSDRFASQLGFVAGPEPKKPSPRSIGRDGDPGGAPAAAASTDATNAPPSSPSEKASEKAAAQSSTAKKPASRKTSARKSGGAAVGEAAPEKATAQEASPTQRREKATAKKVAAARKAAAKKMEQDTAKRVAAAKRAAQKKAEANERAAQNAVRDAEKKRAAEERAARVAAEQREAEEAARAEAAQEAEQAGAATTPETMAPDTAEPDVAESEDPEPESSEPEMSEPESSEPEMSEPDVGQRDTPSPPERGGVARRSDQAVVRLRSSQRSQPGGGSPADRGVQPSAPTARFRSGSAVPAGRVNGLGADHDDARAEATTDDGVRDPDQTDEPTSTGRRPRRTRQLRAR